MPGNAANRSQPVTLDRVPVTSLRGVGPRVATRLESLGIRTVQDVLFHLPIRYEDRTRTTPIGRLRAGDEALIVGEIQVSEIRYGRRRSLVCAVSDGTGVVYLRFFHFSSSQSDALARGARIACYSEVRKGPHGLEMVHPEYRHLREHDPPPTTETLTPIYPATEGVQQATLRGLTDQALARLDREELLIDHIPAELLDPLGLPTLREALRRVHRPEPDRGIATDGASAELARRRLVFEELLAHFLSMRLLRRKLDARDAPALAASGMLERRFIESLPFDLTGAQSRVLSEVLTDLEKTHPSHRLVQGDVGSGKTVVAAVAALRAIESGYQAAFMAPTELLAEQHFANLRDWLAPLGIEVVWLSGKLASRPREEAMQAVATDQPLLAIGTHALFQEQVKFARLGLTVVDEQHRFGVHQRLALSGKGARDDQFPHQLIMTATPIPRTLAMTAYADLDTSVIDELPPGRQPIETAVIPSSRRSEVVARVHAACREGQQAYWVCTSIEESESLQVQAAVDTSEQLAAALDGVRVGLVHGRMKPSEKEAIMAAFKGGDLQLLVATTVIEVGVDVPNATLMIIENAERLGLAQLHQLRGRVGRGAKKSVCVMVYQAPLSRNAWSRLNVLRETTDGFRIAQRDLELRGPGEVLGTKQTGLAQLRIANLLDDRELVPAATRAGAELLRRYPERVAALIQRWVGDALHYGGV